MASDLFLWRMLVLLKRLLKIDEFDDGIVGRKGVGEGSFDRAAGSQILI